MSHNPKSKVSETSMLDEVLEYISDSNGLHFMTDESQIVIKQTVDEKSIHFNREILNEVLHRQDSRGKPFLQVNFKSGIRILVTDSLIGFKPVEIAGLDMSRLPKVVTTPDLKIVFEAIEESLGSEGSVEQEIEILKKVYFSILNGAERTGFKLEKERAWVGRLMSSKHRASA